MWESPLNGKRPVSKTGPAGSSPASPAFFKTLKLEVKQNGEERQKKDKNSNCYIFR